MIETMEQLNGVRTYDQFFFFHSTFRDVCARSTAASFKQQPAATRPPGITQRNAVRPERVSFRKRIVHRVRFRWQKICPRHPKVPQVCLSHRVKTRSTTRDGWIFFCFLFFFFNGIAWLKPYRHSRNSRASKSLQPSPRSLSKGSEAGKCVIWFVIALFKQCSRFK